MSLLAIDPELAFYIACRAHDFETELPLESADADEQGPEDVADDGTPVVIVGRTEEGADGNAAAAAHRELKDILGSLNEDEAVDLVALVWIGRGEFAAADWAGARSQARDVHPNPVDTALDLLADPQLGASLEEGLALLGHSTDTYLTGRL